VRRNRPRHFVSLAVYPLFARKRHPLYLMLLNLFSAQNTRDGHSYDPIFSGPPHDKIAVLAVEPPRKFVLTKPFFDTHVKKLPDEPPLCATVTIIVYQLRLVPLLTACYQFCTCNKKREGSSFLLSNVFIFYTSS
jgi:hypothetical protein